MEDWRRIDIDVYYPESRISEEELKPYAKPVSLEEIQIKAQQIRSLLSKGSFIDALAYAIDEPPFGGDAQTKELHLKSVVDILTAVKQSEISSIVKQLTIDQQDILVKYLYKAMGSKIGQQQGGIILSWFDKTVEITGNGPIVRYISDRNTV
ncbi:hypothetical protein PACTADRAFT_47649 [Pachysolen tannophilus NRRL Y-2460]|uniref:Actin-related protein 2/3 complex subunit 5 n=1 Tax=Pachysolen tannophilus NRRL Y-2460 TaxID=669874 RepID=A0A1E4U1B5_PACTA|nr:hypothetical protein PACTADRAFT_47649 [Pachysolen tannophilus NRRL Y-2460]